MATGLEHLCALGVDMYGIGGEVSKMRHAVEGASSRQLRQLAGNGMHCHTMASFLFFILGNVDRRDDCSARGVLTSVRSFEDLPDGSDEEEQGEQHGESALLASASSSSV